MKHITEKIKYIYRYNGVDYKVSDRKSLKVGDLFYDSRDNSFKIIESKKDLLRVCCMAPEIYAVLDKVE